MNIEPEKVIPGTQRLAGTAGTGFGERRAWGDDGGGQAGGWQPLGRRGFADVERGDCVRAQGPRQGLMENRQSSFCCGRKCPSL